MGKPRMIILIRHAQSEGNKNRDIHQAVPDHRVKLTPEGWRQAQEAGERLRSMLRPDDTLHFFTSPYRRTRETTEGILTSLTSDSPSPSPFPRHTIKVYEEPRLREQDFGNFQPCSAAMERMWQERADYGHFFYRIANGESAADAYDRISGFNESLWRQFGEDDCASVCVLVTHGLMTRVFLMKWYHFSVEYFEDLRNVNHCEFVVMKKNAESGKYILENKLRTWSELKRQRALAEPKSPNKPRGGHHIPIRKRWGGCPNGCDHGFSRQTDFPTATSPSTSHPPQSSPTSNSTAYPPEDKDDQSAPRGRPALAESHAAAPPPGLFSPSDTVAPPQSRTVHRLQSPIPIAVLQAGRDFGGSDSGAASRAGSVASEDDQAALPDGEGEAGGDRTGRAGAAETHRGRDLSTMDSGALANALGDHGEGAGGDEEEEEREDEEAGMRASVY